MFTFTVVHQSRRSRARAGIIATPHGTIETPAFVPVATNGALKGVDSTVAAPLHIPLMFCNTYHLMLHPGAETVATLGGLHRFMGRSGPIITDSGGFQVFSLAYGSVHDELKSRGQKKSHGSVLKIDETGVTFRSYRNGESIHLSPETSVMAQKQLGADIILPLDELPPYHTDPNTLRRSFDRTHRWQLRSLQEHLSNTNQQAMYGIIHGGIDSTLRLQSARTLAQLPFDGTAIGGSLGKNLDEMVTMLTTLTPHLDAHRPIHLLGIADLPSLHATIPLGIDTFDSCYPTRVARHGLLFTAAGPVKILQSIHRASSAPLDESCPCITCTQYSRGYLHHLFKAHELSAYTLASLHNVTHMTRVMSAYRTKILHNEI